MQAILVLDPDADVDAIVRAANAQLGDHQKIRAAAVWPERELPRTEGTRKLKRRELKQWLAGQQPAAGAPAAAGPRTAATVLERFAPGRAVASSTTIDELGLSSLERVELMMALEEAFQVTVDEAQFARRANRRRSRGADAAACEAGGRCVAAAVAEPIDFPSWNRSCAGARAAAREPADLDPAARTHLHVARRQRPRAPRATSTGPVIFAANHQSHLDTPAILQALPPRWRYRVAPAMAKEFFKAHFYPEQFSRRRWSHQQPELLPGVAASSTPSRCRSGKRARGRRCATSASWSAAATRS